MPPDISSEARVSCGTEIAMYKGRVQLTRAAHDEARPRMAQPADKK